MQRVLLIGLHGFNSQIDFSFCIFWDFSCPENWFSMRKQNLPQEDEASHLHLTL